MVTTSWGAVGSRNDTSIRRSSSTESEPGRYVKSIVADFDGSMVDGEILATAHPHDVRSEATVHRELESFWIVNVLERLTKLQEDMETYQTRGECEKGGVDVFPALVANPQSALLMQPTDGSLHDPTNCFQAAAVRGAAFGEKWLNPQPTQNLACRFGIVRAVRIQRLGPGFRVARFSTYLGNSDDQGQQLFHIRHVRTGDADRQRHSVTIDQHMVLGARSRTVGRVGSSRFTPANSTNTAGIYGRMRPVDFVGTSQFSAHHGEQFVPVSYTHLRAYETVLDIVCRLLLEKKKKSMIKYSQRTNTQPNNSNQTIITRNNTEKIPYTMITTKQSLHPT